MSVTARFFVQQFTKHANFSHTAVVLMPVSRATDDNVNWAKYTPSGKIELNVSHDTPAAAWFEKMLGEDVAITFDAAVDARPGTP